MSLHSEFFGLLLSERDLRGRHHDEIRRRRPFMDMVAGIREWAVRTRKAEQPR
ncbi:hypothetical protein D3C87_1723360 [compost metagenome]